MPFECSGCSAGHLANSLVLLREYIKFHSENDEESALLHFNEVMGNLRQAEEQMPDKQFKDYIREKRKFLEGAFAEGNFNNIIAAQGDIQYLGSEAWKYLEAHPELCKTCELSGNPNPSPKLPPRGTGLEIGTTRKERGKGKPLSEEERKTRHRSNPITEWIAYCMDCKKEIFRAPNGAMVEAEARKHVKETGHKVLVGLEFGSSNPTKREEEIIEIGGKKYRQVIEPIKSKKEFAPESFRTICPKCPPDGRCEKCPPEIKDITTRIIIGCPKGEWNPETERCDVGTETHLIYHELEPIKSFEKGG